MNSPLKQHAVLQLVLELAGVVRAAVVSSSGRETGACEMVELAERELREF